MSATAASASGRKRPAIRSGQRSEAGSDQKRAASRSGWQERPASRSSRRTRRHPLLPRASRQAMHPLAPRACAAHAPNQGASHPTSGRPTQAGQARSHRCTGSCLLPTPPPLTPSLSRRPPEHPSMTQPARRDSLAHAHDLPAHARDLLAHARRRPLPLGGVRARTYRTALDTPRSAVMLVTRSLRRRHWLAGPRWQGQVQRRLHLHQATPMAQWLTRSQRERWLHAGPRMPRGCGCAGAVQCACSRQVGHVHRD